MDASCLVHKMISAMTAVMHCGLCVPQRTGRSTNGLVDTRWQCRICRAGIHQLCTDKRSNSCRSDFITYLSLTCNYLSTV